MSKVKDANVSEEIVVDSTIEAAPEYVMEGFEESEVTLQSLPILTLAQSQTPEVVEGEIPGLKAGVLMNSTTKLPMGAEIEMIAYKLWPGRTKFPPRSEGGPIQCFSPDGINGRTYGTCKSCAFSDFALKDRCQDQKFFVVAPASNPSDLYRMIFAKSNFRVGKILENTLKSECNKRKLPIYGMKFILSTKRLKNESAGSYYYVFDVKPSEPMAKEDFAELSTNFKMITELRKDSLDEFYRSHEEVAEDADEVDDNELPPGMELSSDGDALL